MNFFIIPSHTTGPNYVVCDGMLNKYIYLPENNVDVSAYLLTYSVVQSPS